MLKTQPVSETPPPTSQEIAQAIAALEARSASHTDDTSQTVAVGEVIRHLGLDMTPEDVLAEVQAQRARGTRFGSRLPMRTKRLLGLLIPGGLAILWALVELLTPSYPNDTPAPVSIQASYIHPPTHLDMAPDALVQDTVGHVTMLKTWSEIPDGHSAQCPLSLTGLGFTDANEVGDMNALWTLVKYHGKAYLRCWMVPMSPQAMQRASQHNGVNLFCFQANGATAPFTLPLPYITTSQQEMGNRIGSIDAATLRLDSHAHEKWTP